MNLVVVRARSRIFVSSPALFQPSLRARQRDEVLAARALRCQIGASSSATFGISMFRNGQWGARWCLRARIDLVESNYSTRVVLVLAGLHAGLYSTSIWMV
jgi:hypothetical protein